MVYESQFEFVKILIDLIRNGTIVAVDETTPYSNNHFTFTYNGIRFDTEWLQDDRPMLFADGELIIEGHLFLHECMYELQKRFSQKAAPSPGDRDRQEQVRRQRQAFAQTLEKLKKKHTP